MIKLIFISKLCELFKIEEPQVFEEWIDPPPPSTFTPRNIICEIAMQVKCDINVGKCISQTTNIHVFINYEYMC